MASVEPHTAPYENNPFAWDVADENGDLPAEPYNELRFLSKLLFVNYTITSVGGGIASFLLLYLVLFKTLGTLKQYQNMLLICCATDLWYWSVDNFMYMKLGEKDGVLIVQMDGLAGFLNHRYRILTISTYMWTICMVNAMLPVQLYFRYYSLSSTSPMERPGFNYGTLWFKEYPLPPLVFGDVRSNYHKALFLYGGLVISVSHLLSTVIGYKTWCQIRQMHDSYSERTRRLQKQLTNFMIVQVVTPLFISVIPVMTIVIPSFLFIDTGRICLYSALMFSWIPVFNPVITITVIVPFRRFVLGVVTRKRGLVHTGHTKSDSPNPRSATDLVVA
uniref:G_PROTEIN_RECEP_F1_2 domain-containing protein n=1 Tax=Bursaphelenchus xylophilus TaxID=6326 RepID=A0A1I7RJW7_BURXY